MVFAIVVLKRVECIWNEIDMNWSRCIASYRKEVLPGLEQISKVQHSTLWILKIKRRMMGIFEPGRSLPPGYGPDGVDTV